MIDLKELIEQFFDIVESSGIEIYNEFSLQHELGIFLRNKLPGYKIQFERNVSFFTNDTDTIKKEIDISKKKFARLKYKLYLCIVESSTTDRTGFRKTKK